MQPNNPAFCADLLQLLDSYLSSSAVAHLLLSPSALWFPCFVCLTVSNSSEQRWTGRAGESAGWETPECSVLLQLVDACNK